MISIKSQWAARGLALLGGLLLAGSVLCAMGIAIGIWRNGFQPGTQDLPSTAEFILFPVWGLLTGFGLLRKRRWAAILFSVPCLLLSFLLIISVLSGRGAGAFVADTPIVNCGVALALIVPGILTVSGWSAFQCQTRSTV